MIRDLILTLRLWLQIKAQREHYDLQRQIEADIETDENKISALRASADPADQLAADRLRDRIVRAQGIAANLPATGAPAPGGSAGANPAGNLTQPLTQPLPPSQSSSIQLPSAFITRRRGRHESRHKEVGIKTASRT